MRRETPALLPCTQDAIREAGGIPPLVYLLQAGNDDDVLEATGAWLAQSGAAAGVHSTAPACVRGLLPPWRSLLGLLLPADSLLVLGSLSAGALAQLCLSPAVVGDVIASGGVASLVALLAAYAQSKPPSDAHAAAACTACGSLAVHPGLHAQLAGAGVVTHLVTHLQGPSPSIAQAAAHALATMAGRSDVLLRQALAAGALEAATGLLAAGAAGQATTGACALLAALLTQGGDDVRDAFTALDGIDAVVDVLDVRQVGAPGVGGGATVVMALCAGGSPGAAEAVADVVQHTDAISRLVAILSTAATPRDTAVRAAQALGELASGPGAKDTMYAAGAIPPLVRLLQPGDPDDAATGAVASVLARLADTHAGCRDGVATCGGIPLLVQLLSPPLPSVGATAAAGALWYLARSAANKEAIREAGGVPALVALLVCGPDCDVTFKAAAALWSLADSSAANKEAIREAGGIPALVRLLSCGPERRATLKAAGALGSLAFAPANKEAIRQARAIPALVTLLRCGPARAITLNATVALSNLASSPEARADMVADGALPLLLALLEAPSGREVVAVSAGVVAKLCQADGGEAGAAAAPEAGSDARQAVLDAGGVAPLVHVVRTASPDGAAVVNAACALWHLGSSPAGGFAVRQEGGLDALVALLQAPDASVEAVTKGGAALWTLAEGSGANADAIINAHGAEALVALLLEGGTSRAAVNAAGALGALAAASQVAASECARGGACAALGQLISLLRASGGEPGPKPQAEGPLVVALTSLCRLAAHPAGLAACRAVPGLVELLVDVCGVGAATEGAPWAVPAVTALTFLAAGGHGPTCEAIRAAGGVPALVGLLHWPHWPEATAAAAAACGVLARGGPVLRDELHQLATPPLLALLRPGGDAPTAAAAAAAFGALAAAAPVEREYVRTCGALELLYAMVKDTSLPDCCEAAASALAAAVVDSYGNKAILRDAGAMALCAQLVQAPPSSGAAAAVALLLGRLAEGAGRGATPIGSPRAASPRPGSVFEPQAPGAQAPGSSSPVPSEHEDALLASGAVTQLVSHLGGHPDAPVTRAAVSSLASMADSSDGCAAIIARDGGLAHLVALLDAGYAHSVAADAAALLGHLASQPGGKDALREAGAIPKLVALLPGGPASAAAVHAAEVLWVLADGSAANQEEMLACAAPVSLLRMLSDALQPGAGASGEEEGGDDRAALNGAGALCSLAETPAGVEALLAAGGVAPLVELLRGEGYVESTVIAAVALSHVADSGAGRSELVAQGVVPVLVAHLNAGPEHDITVLSATLLAKLAEADDAHAREEIAEHESGHLFLIALLYAMSYHECVLQAATTLWFLARDPVYAQLLLDSGVVPALLGVLGNAEEDPDAGAIAAAALAAICAGSADRTAAVAALGGLEGVAQALLAPGCALDSQLAGRSAWTLAALAEAGGAQVADAVVATGVVPRLVAQLDCGAGVDATLAGASALGALATTPAGQEAILGAGVCAPLVALLASGPEAPVTVAAARLLTTLATGSGPAREAIRVAGGIQPLVTLLQSGPEAPVTAKAAAALVALAKSPENKEEIRRAGGIAQLVALLGAAAKAGSPRPGSPVRERPLPPVVEAQ